MKQMKQIAVLGLMALGAAWSTAAASPEALTKAVKQLADQANYSWTTSTKEADGSAGRLGTIEGKAEKGGVTGISFSVSEIPIEVFMKGEKGAAKAFEGWQSFDELAQTGGTAAAVVRYLKSFKAPAAELTELAAKTTGLKEADGALAGELKEDVIKELLLFGTRRREGAEPPKMTDTKGSIKYWVKDGALTKYEINVKGKISAGDRDTEVDRTTTVEIKDAGATKLEVPDEAKQKMT